jgi:hypothetical protein
MCTHAQKYTNKYTNTHRFVLSPCSTQLHTRVHIHTRTYHFVFSPCSTQLHTRVYIHTSTYHFVFSPCSTRLPCARASSFAATRAASALSCLSFSFPWLVNFTSAVHARAYIYACTKHTHIHTHTNTYTHTCGQLLDVVFVLGGSPHEVTPHLLQLLACVLKSSKYSIVVCIPRSLHTTLHTTHTHALTHTHTPPSRFLAHGAP